MRLSVLLADKGTNNPQAGTLNLLNIGWKSTVLIPAAGIPGGLLTPPHAVAVFFEVEHQRCNRPIDLVLRLVTEDGAPVVVPSPSGEQPLVVTQRITVVSPPGVPLGTLGAGNALIEIMPGLPLQPGGYRWEATLDGETDENWTATFRASPPPQPMATMGIFGTPGGPGTP